MFGKDFFAKREPRKFRFTPYHYEIEGNEKEPGNKIKFTALRHRGSVSKKSVTGMVLLVGLLLFFVIYFWQTIEQAGRVYDLDSIKIEDTTTGK